MPSSPEPAPDWVFVVLRALAYAAAITALVLYAPSESYDFIYWGF